MIKYYIMIVLAAALIAVQFILGKLYNNKSGSGLASTLKFNIVNGIVNGLLLWALNGFTHTATTYTIVMAFFLSFLFTAIGICNVAVLAKGDTSVYSMFSMLGLMSLPFLYGVTFLNEGASVFKIIALVVLIISLIVPVFGNKNRKKGDNVFYILCVLVFCINGAIAVVSKIHQVSPKGTNAYDLISIMYFFSSIMSAIGLVIVFFVNKKKGLINTKGNINDTKKIFFIALGINTLYAIVSGVGYLLQCFAAVYLDASVLYPIVTGGTVILSTLLAWPIYKEKPTLPIVIGVILTTIATIMFAF